MISGRGSVQRAFPRSAGLSSVQLGAMPNNARAAARTVAPALCRGMTFASWALLAAPIDLYPIAPGRIFMASTMKAFDATMEPMRDQICPANPG